MMWWFGDIAREKEKQEKGCGRIQVINNKNVICCRRWELGKRDQTRDDRHSQDKRLKVAVG